MFFNIIRIIGPINSPSTPDTLNPVYMAIKVNIGCIPIWFPTIRGSINCLTTDITIHKPKTHNASVILPLHADIIAQGIITVPEPNIGSASTKPIPIAYNNG